MSVSVRFIYDTPQREVASLLRSLYGRCTSASLVAGFMTVEGIKALAQQVRAAPSKLASLVIGAGTLGAFEAFDQLLSDGVQPDRLRVHLGHSRPNGRSQFTRYHPMLHSKVYFFELADGTSAAFVGSHNLTRFALYGLNGEAGMLLEGPADDALFSDIRAHVNAAIAGSVQYDPADRDAYAWWAEQYMQGLAAEFGGPSEEGTAKRTIIILAEGKGPRLPSIGEVVYFEFPKAIGKVQSMSAEVHLYVFDVLPQSPYAALSQLSKARASYLCTMRGLEDDSGAREEHFLIEE